MKVVVHTLERGKPDFYATRKTFSWPGTESDKKWLHNHLHWAMNNKHAVTLIPESN
jgi:hypothetical protein